MLENIIKSEAAVYDGKVWDQDMKMIYADAEESLAAIRKKSRLRIHYLRLVLMNNILRAFVTLYELDPIFKSRQEAMLDALKRVEQSRNRVFLTSDLIAIQEAITSYRDILDSCTKDQIDEVLFFIDKNKTECKWAISERKSLKSSRRHK